MTRQREFSHVLKFGGSSIGTPKAMGSALKIIISESERNHCVIVVSALGGVTDGLIKAAQLARKRERKSLAREIHVLEEKHQVIVDALSKTGKIRRELEQVVANYFKRITDLLQGVSLLKECSPKSQDEIISYGEIISAHLISGLLWDRGIRAVPIDTRQLIRTDDSFGSAQVDLKISYKNLRQAICKLSKRTLPIVTGFIGATKEGITTTIGRSGSDYTASIVGSALGVREIQIWTDVDGILSANPAQVEDAFVLPRLSYKEAMEMAYFGAQVIYPKTMIPAVEQSIPIRIKNTFNPEAPGTCIGPDAGEHVVAGVRSITSLEQLALVSVEGGGMVGVPGVAGRLFGVLARNNINIILISQASSEHSICFVIQESEADQARKIIWREFELECAGGRISHINVHTGVAIVAVVGEHMRGTPGISGKLFGVLGKNKINVIAIAQGSSERNISVVIDQKDVRKAINLVHGVFQLSRRTINLVVLGAGNVGSLLLEQIESQYANFERDLALEIRVVAIATSKHWLFNKNGIPLSSWRSRLGKCPGHAGINWVIELLDKEKLENLIVIDVTGNDEVSLSYPRFLTKGYSIVTPNKRANTASMAYYKEIKEALRRRNSYYFYETTVGAALPIISTLENLIKTGDEVIHIQGVLSGTLSYIFKEVSAGQCFSEAVRSARDKGYTEPDPRDDLSGRDVARKLLILAREIGLDIELKDVQVQDLVPSYLKKIGDVNTFLKRLSEIDGEFSKRAGQATKGGKVLCYVGEIKDGICSAGLKEVALDSSLARLSGSDNIVTFRTKRYDQNPLVIQGPGAGLEVTAAGILADILTVAYHLTNI